MAMTSKAAGCSTYVVVTKAATSHQAVRFGQVEALYSHKNTLGFQKSFKPTAKVAAAAATRGSFIVSSVGSQVASKRLRRPQNVEGEFFVDHTCIDCDTCRWMAPDSFTRVGEMSAVHKQPTSSEERLKALQALICCPTSSIHTEKPPHDVLQAHETFPMPIDEHKIPGVYLCGYHSEKSYGATSYLIIHPEGNIFVDSPRCTKRLARKIENLGGARYMFLTHRDDVADHDKWAAQLGCERIIHLTDVRESTVDVETKLEGSGPWNLGEDIQLVHTPGHSEGSVCLYHKPLRVLFTGDHLMMTASGMGMLEEYNHFSYVLQLDNIKKLLEYDFKWILPGHGRRIEFKDYQEKNSVLEALLEEKYKQYLPKERLK